jgi:hypothetical protein
MNDLKENNVVVLKNYFGHIPNGTKGIIIFDYGVGNMVEVEFVDAENNTISIESVFKNELKKKIKNACTYRLNSVSLPYQFTQKTYCNGNSKQNTQTSSIITQVAQGIVWGRQGKRKKDLEEGEKGNGNVLPKTKKKKVEEWIIFFFPYNNFFGVAFATSFFCIQFNFWLIIKIFFLQNTCTIQEYTLSLHYQFTIKTFSAMNDKVIFLFISAICSAIVFLVVDLTMGKSEYSKGIVTEKHYSTSATSVGTSTGVTSNGQSVVSTHVEYMPENFVLFVKDDNKQIFAVTCESNIYHAKNLGDAVQFKIVRSLFTKTVVTVVAIQ